MRIIQLLISIALIILIFSCDKKDDDLTSNVMSYPISPGTEWTYERQIIIKQFESATSDHITKIDTINSIVKVWIDKDTLLNDTMNVSVFKSRENDNHWTSTQFKYIDDQGLRNYAYSNPWGAHVFATSRNNIRSTFNILSQIIEPDKRSINEDIIIEEHPTLDLKLPLQNNALWTYRHYSESTNMQIDKKVTGTETLNLIGQIFTCFKVDWEYIQQPMDSYKITDWISNKGLIKRITKLQRASTVSEDGELLINGSIEYSETLILKKLIVR